MQIIEELISKEESEDIVNSFHEHLPIQMEGSGRIRGKEIKVIKKKPPIVPYKSVIDKLKELRVVRHPLKKLKIIFEAKQLIT